MSYLTVPIDFFFLGSGTWKQKSENNENGKSTGSEKKGGSSGEISIMAETGNETFCELKRTKKGEPLTYLKLKHSGKWMVKKSPFR